MDLATTGWLRHDATTIEALYTNSGASSAASSTRVLLRLFVHFHGQKIILILHGYDKGRDDSPRRQNKEIQEARKRLRSWKAAEVAKRKR